MKSTTGNVFLFGGVVLLALVSVLVIAAPHAIQPKTQTPADEQQKKDATPALTVREEKPQTSPFSIIYFTRENGAAKIFRSMQDGSNPKLIYSDAKDNDKLKAVAAIKNDGSAIYLLIGSPDQEFNGKLEEIMTDGKAAVKILQENISYTTAPTVSPVGDKMATVSFTNDEANIGFTVTLQNLDGSDAKTIYKSQETVSLTDFSSDGKKLAIVKASPSGGSQVVVADLSANTNQGIYSTANTILSIDYELTGVAVAEAPTGANQANNTEIVKFDSDGKNVTKLTTNQLAETSLRFDPDGKQIGYVQISYPDGQAQPNVTGNLVRIDIDKKNESVIGKAVGVIGWTR